MTRVRTAAMVIAVISLTAAGSFAAGSRITSPAEVASRTAPPTPSLILVPVEERVLSTNVVSRGTGRFGSPQKLSVTISALKTGPGLVGAVPAAATDLAEGDVVMNASGRPLFILRGAKPMARDLGPGASGDDVRQLEEALARLGFDPGPLDGTYDERTAGAVAAWYGAKGYTPFGATAEQLAIVRSREAELATASVELLNTADSVANADAARSAARAAFETARRRVDSTTRAADRARAEAAAASNAAASEIAARQSALDSFLTANPAAAPTDITAAQADVRSAKTTAETGRFATERAQDDAAIAAADAANDLSAKQAALNAAEAAVPNAARLVVARNGVLQAATDQRDLARLRTGVQVPADELVFVTTMPVRIAESLVAPGDAAGGAIAKVTDAVAHIEAALAINDANLVKPGMRVKIDEPDLGIAVEGTVTRIASAPGTNGVDGFHVFCEIAVPSPPANLVGASVRLTIPVRSTGAAVLAVPISALTLGPDGSSRVQRQIVHGGTEFVIVEAGLSADGYVAVTARDGSLKVGDHVVAGQDQRA